MELYSKTVYLVKKLPHQLKSWGKWSLCGIQFPNPGKIVNKENVALNPMQYAITVQFGRGGCFTSSHAILTTIWNSA